MTFEKVIDVKKSEEILNKYANHHIGRILHKAGDGLSPVYRELIKKEVWHFTNNVKKDIFDLEPSYPPKF